MSCCRKHGAWRRPKTLVAGQLAPRGGLSQTSHCGQSASHPWWQCSLQNTQIKPHSLWDICARSCEQAEILRVQPGPLMMQHSGGKQLTDTPLTGQTLTPQSTMRPLLGEPDSYRGAAIALLRHTRPGTANTLPEKSRPQPSTSRRRNGHLHRCRDQGEVGPLLKWWSSACCLMRRRETAVLLGGVALPTCAQNAGGALIQRQSAVVVDPLRVE